MSFGSWINDRAKAAVLHAVISYLETVDIPGAERKAIAVTLLNILHIQTGVFTAGISEEISNAIEWTLAKIRAAAAAHDPANAPAVPAPPPHDVPPVDTTVPKPEDEVYDSVPPHRDGYDIYSRFDGLFVYWPHAVGPVPPGYVKVG